MSDGEVHYVRDGSVATVTFDRPAARNAMTWRMYEQLAEACRRMQQEAGLRVAVFRGAGGRSFIAGTDIAQFQAFRGGEDGIRDWSVTGVQTCALPISASNFRRWRYMPTCSKPASGQGRVISTTAR